MVFAVASPFFEPTSIAPSVESGAPYVLERGVVASRVLPGPTFRLPIGKDFGAVPVGTLNVDAQIFNGRVLDLQTYETDVIHIANGRSRLRVGD